MCTTMSNFHFRVDPTIRGNRPPQPSAPSQFISFDNKGTVTEFTPSYVDPNNNNRYVTTTPVKLAPKPTPEPVRHEEIVGGVFHSFEHAFSSNKFSKFTYHFVTHLESVSNEIIMSFYAPREIRSITIYKEEVTIEFTESIIIDFRVVADLYLNYQVIALLDSDKNIGELKVHTEKGDDGSNRITVCRWFKSDKASVTQTLRIHVYHVDTHQCVATFVYLINVKN